MTSAVALPRPRVRLSLKIGILVTLLAAVFAVTFAPEPSSAAAVPVSAPARAPQVAAAADIAIPQNLTPRSIAPAAKPLGGPVLPAAAANVATKPTTPASKPASPPPANQSCAYGCAAALAYLAANAAPGFTFQCPGNSFGHQAMTCINHAPECPGQKIIAITVPCAAAYMNEAHNSWVLMKLRAGKIDPYGYCH